MLKKMSTNVKPFFIFNIGFICIQKSFKIKNRKDGIENEKDGRDYSVGNTFSFTI